MKSILVIEDFADSQEIITNWIEKTFNGRAFGASTVKEALYLLEKNSFDVIVCDYELPDGNGEEILSFLRRNRIETPTILFSAHSDLSSDIVPPVIHVIKDKSFFRLFDFIKSLP